MLMVCTLADSARCFSGHMANDNPVHSFFVVTVDTWAGVVLCGAGGYYAFEVNTFSHSKGSDPADFFQTLALLHRTFFIYFYYTLTLQSSPPRYMWLTCPHPFARVWAPWHFCKKKNRDSLPPLQRCWTRRRLIPNPNAENTARSQLYGEKKNCLPVRSRFVPTPTRNNHTANTTC